VGSDFGLPRSTEQVITFGAGGKGLSLVSETLGCFGETFFEGEEMFHPATTFHDWPCAIRVLTVGFLAPGILDRVASAATNKS
jgi:hypothetical protein